MRSRIPTLALPAESAEFADELRRIFGELAGATPEWASGECSPPVDVYETEALLEIVVDLPGVTATAIRVVLKGPTVLIAGHKLPRRGRGDSSFHLVERDFGRFIRTVRLPRPFDGSRARASLAEGELRVSLPKVRDRRGTSIAVPVTSERPIA
jgi:HSP20 family protein